jgi:hypothetical protein
MLLGESDCLVFGDQIKPVQYSLTVTQFDPAKKEVTLDGGNQFQNILSERKLFPFGKQ